MSKEVCEEVLAEHASEASGKIFVFIDNLIDSMDAIHRLLALKGKFQIVSTEASYVFDSVHFRSGIKVRVFSCSELDASDRQRIIDSVPQALRRPNLSLDVRSFDDAGEIGLFESLQRHVFDDKLRQRFRASLREFERIDQEAFDAYIMACYMAECRSVVSFDMMFVFHRKSGKTYEDVYRTCERISAFLIDHNIEGEVDQDYFSVRSKALARLALNDISNPTFSRMYQRFHSVISDKIIPDYRVFRRYAYDNEHARRAFPQVKAGQAFYERLVARTTNQYDYQHGATYLSKMKEFKKAFVWIDKALSLSGGRIFSIRNSHARILFEANIDVARLNHGNQTARAGLKESLEVLNECLQRDSRKSYHLLRFCDQAMQYWDAYGDVDADAWLNMAHKELTTSTKDAEKAGSRDAYNQAAYRRVLRDMERLLPTPSQSP